jgi:hypothetical protein
MAMERIVVVRRGVAGAASMAIAGRLFSESFHLHGRFDWREATYAAILIGVPMIAGVLAWSRRLGLQLLARAFWWSILIMSLLATLMSGGATNDGRFAAFAVACAGLALLAIGRVGLGAEAARFQPVAFRGTLQLSLVLAMADTAALAFCAVCWFLDGRAAVAVGKVLLFPAFTGLGVVGLLRLRTWGLLVAVASNLLVGTLALTKNLPVPYPLTYVFIATAAIQLLVPLPMIVRLVLRRGPPPDRWQTFRTVGANLAILSLVALGVYAGLFRDAPLWYFVR